MPDKPAGEVAIDESLVRHLVVTQAADAIPDAATAALVKVAEGWDCEVWRLGQDLAVRVPRRALAAPLILNERRALPVLAALISSSGLRVPMPVFDGMPDARYPWAWSIVPWVSGSMGLDIPRPDRRGWAAPLASALVALHAPAPEDPPINPFRGTPLAPRSPVIEERLAGVLASGVIDQATAAAAGSIWRTGVGAAPWAEPAVWIHGDLHPGNLIARGAELIGIIDFGDVTAGDPAYDLSVAWLAFDAAGRRTFIAATGGRYDAATWVRAHAWATAIALLLLANSDDNPAYARLGRDSLAEVIRAGR